MLTALPDSLLSKISTVEQLEKEYSEMQNGNSDKFDGLDAAYALMDGRIAALE